MECDISSKDALDPAPNQNELLKRVAIVTNNTNCERHVQYYSTLEKYFMANGWYIKDNFDVDMVVITGCGFHNMMLEKVKNLLDELKTIEFEQNVVLTGCLPTTHASEWKEGFKGSVVKLDGEAALDGIIGATVPFKEVKPSNMLKPHEESMSTGDKKIFHIKIEDGCMRQCTFCVIHKAKGRVRSLPEEQIEDQFRKGIEAGYKRVFLMGEDTFAYGQDTGTNIIDLVNRLVAISSDIDIEFGNLDHRWLVKYIDGVIDLCQKGVISKLHVGMQHNNERLLIRMGRGGTTFQELYGAITKLKKACPNVYLGADIIVGFPGETEEMFKELMDFFEDEPYIDNVQHTSFSAIDGAPASNFADAVPSMIVGARWARLTRLLGTRTAFNRAEKTDFDLTFKETRDNDYSFVRNTLNILDNHH